MGTSALKISKFQNVKISCGLKIAKTEGWNFILIISNNEVDHGLFNVESLFAPGYEYSYDTDEHLCDKQILFVTMYEQDSCNIMDSSRPPQDVDVLAVLGFENLCSRPETPDTQEG